MNISNKEKKILIIVACILSITMYVQFFIRPQLDKISDAKDELKKVQVEYGKYEVLEQRVKKLYLDLAGYKKKIEKIRSKYPPHLFREDLLVLIKYVGYATKVEVNSIQFGSMDPVSGESKEVKKEEGGGLGAIGGNISDFKLQELIKGFGLQGMPGGGKQEGEEEKVIPNGKAFSITATLVIEGTYDDIKIFIKTLEDLQAKVVVNNATFSSKGNLMGLSCAIEFLGIKDVGVEYERPKYELPEYGSMSEMPNPEENYEEEENILGNIDSPEIMEELQALLRQPEEQTEEPKVNTNTFDIGATVNPYTTLSPQTLSLSFENVGGVYTNQKPTLASSNKGAEKVNLYFEEKDGKVFTRARVGEDVFPSDIGSDVVELNTEGRDIQFTIVSTPRKGQVDMNTVEFSIINKTSRDVKVKVMSDDGIFPRVKIKEVMGSIDVVRTE